MIEATCLDVGEENLLCLLLPDGNIKEDLKLPTDAHLRAVAK